MFVNFAGKARSLPLVEVAANNKRTSLLHNSMKYCGKKNYTEILWLHNIGILTSLHICMGPGPNVMKLFYARILRMFAISWGVCPRKQLQPSLMFAGKARAYLSEASFWYLTLGQAPSLTEKH